MQSTSDCVALRRVASVERQPLEWLWPGWLPRGLLALLDGDPGMGKSTLAAEVAARVSRGEPLTKGPRQPPANVLMICAEDDPARILRPRLEAAGADLDRVLLIDEGGPQARLPQLPDDLPALAERLLAEKVGLLVIDPLPAFLGRGVTAGNDQQVRRVLHQLQRTADATRCAILMIRHLNKSTGMAALYRGGGSLGILGACRLAWIVGRDPLDDERRVLAMNKCNLGLKPPSLSFRLEQQEGVGRVAWDGECDWTADDVVQPMKDEEAESLGRLDECMEHIQALLGGSEVPLRDFDNVGRAGGFSKRTTRRARKKMQARTFRHLVLGWMVQVPRRGNARG